MNDEKMSRVEIPLPQGVSIRQRPPFSAQAVLRLRKTRMHRLHLPIETPALAPEDQVIEELRALIRNASSAVKHIKSAEKSQRSLLNFPDDVLRRALKTKTNAKLFQSACSERNKLRKPLDRLTAALDRLVHSLQLGDESQCPPLPD
jgi:hypothetical protein